MEENITVKTEIKMSKCHICDKEFDQLEVHFLNCHADEFEIEDEEKDNDEKFIEKNSAENQQIKVEKNELPPLEMEESKSPTDIQNNMNVSDILTNLLDVKPTKDELQEKLLQNTGYLMSE